MLDKFRQSLLSINRNCQTTNLLILIAPLSLDICILTVNLVNCQLIKRFIWIRFHIIFRHPESVIEGPNPLFDSPPSKNELCLDRQVKSLQNEITS